MRYKRQEMEAAYQQLVEQEKPVMALLGAVVGIIPGVLITVFFAHYAFLSMIVASMLFPAVIALFARFVGRPFSVAARVPLAILIGSVYLITGYLLEAFPIWFLASPIPFGVAYIASRRGMSDLQKFAAYEHQIRPFDVDDNPNWAKVLSPLILLTVMCASGYWQFYHASNLCLNSIQADDQQGILESCAVTGVSLEKMATLESWAQHSESEYVEHNFGSYDAQTQEAELIREKASQGELFYLRLWWIIIDNLYRNNLSALSSTGVIQYRDEAQRWRFKAIERHFPLALKKQIKLYTDAPLSTESERTAAISIAQSLLDKGVYGAQELVKAAQSLVTEDMVRSFYRQQINRLDELTLDQAEDLLWAVEEGEFYYYLDDIKQKKHHPKYQSSTYVKVATDSALAVKVLKVMSEQGSADASARLFKHYGIEEYAEEYNEEALYYLTAAAEQGHVASMTQLGVYLFCKDNFEGRVWIKKAADSGHRNAEVWRKRISITPKDMIC